MLLTRWIAALATAYAIAFTMPVGEAEKWLPQVVDQPRVSPIQASTSASRRFPSRFR